MADSIAPTIVCRRPAPPIVYVPQEPLAARIVARVTLPLYLGLAAGAGILIGRFW